MTNKKITTLILTALLTALTTVATMAIRIPTPTLGYIHLGDGLVLLCGILLNPALGAVAAGIGSMLADLFGGYMVWVPGTFAIKALTALVGGFLYRHMIYRDKIGSSVRVALCGLPAEAIMVLGYFGYKVGIEVVAGSGFAAAAITSAASIPFNIVQGLAGIVVAALLLPILSHTNAEMRERILS